MAKRYLISFGTNTESAQRSYVDSNTREEIFKSYIDSELYTMDRVIFTTDSKEEALAEFSKYRSSISVVLSNYGYEIGYEAYELSEETGEYNEDGEWEGIFATPLEIAKLKNE